MMMAITEQADNDESRYCQPITGDEILPGNSFLKPNKNIGNKRSSLDSSETKKIKSRAIIITISQEEQDKKILFSSKSLRFVKNSRGTFKSETIVSNSRFPRDLYLQGILQVLNCCYASLFQVCNFKV